MFDTLQEIPLEIIENLDDTLLNDNLEIIIELLEEILAINHLILASGVAIVISFVIYSTLKKFFY